MEDIELALNIKKHPTTIVQQYTLKENSTSVQSSQIQTTYIQIMYRLHLPYNSLLSVPPTFHKVTRLERRRS